MVASAPINIVIARKPSMKIAILPIRSPPLHISDHGVNDGPCADPVTEAETTIKTGSDHGLAASASSSC